MRSAANMRLTWLGPMLILGILMPQTSGLARPTPDCLSTVNLCMSDLCLATKTGSQCEENAEGCQVSEWTVCNMSLASVLGQFPSLRACVCEQEADLCDSIPALLAQCHQKPAAQWQKSSKNAWKSSTLLDLDHDASNSCLESIGLCLGDAVCNRFMAPVLRECTAPNCERRRCQEATGSFYRDMPLHVAQLLVMCQCQDSDDACVRMSSALHSGMCGTDRRNCLHTASQCVEDRSCRKRLSVLQSRCWRDVEPQCLNDLPAVECFSQMKPALILGAHTECQTAFVATVGTSLHFPCTCEGLLGPDLQTCSIIHEVFHNRTHLLKPWKGRNDPTEPSDRSEDALFDLRDYLLPGVACLLLMGITVLAVSIIIWLSRRKRKNKLPSYQKSHSVIL